MPPKKKPRKTARRKRKTATMLKIERDCKRNKRKYSKRYIQLINYIKCRDGWRCIFPGCSKPAGVRLQIHHLQRYSDNIRLRQNKYNLASICTTCHRAISNQEKKWAPRLKIIVRRNELEYRKNRLTKEQILEKLKEQQQLPDGFESYVYKSDSEIIKVKKEEYWLTKYYRQIKFRTENKSSNSYKNYGGRGIKMCDEWKKSYEKFADYIQNTLGDRPEGASIDRIDNDRGYEPGNLRWATDELQGQNRSTNVLTEESAAVVLILYYKYKFKISEILDRVNLPSRSAVNGCVSAKSWANVCLKYKSIITNEKALKLLDEYESKQVKS